MTSPPEVDKDALLVRAALDILTLECEIEKLQQQIESAAPPPTLESVWKKNLKVSINPQVLRQSKREYKQWNRSRKK